LTRDKDVKVLVELGFTGLQAKVYLALSELEEANIIEISKAINVARQEIYRIVTELQNRGLVEKRLAKPVRYKAISIQEAVPYLLMDMHKKRIVLQRKAMQLVERQKSIIGKPKLLEAEAQFLLIPKRGTLSRKIKKTIEDSKKSIEIVLPHEKFLHALFDLAQSLKKALERNVKVRWIIDKPLSPDEKPVILEFLLKSTLFELRCKPHNPALTFGIYDGKTVIVASNPKLNYIESPAIWTNAVPFVALAQNYFDTLWNSLQESCHSPL